jgi:hypothetical protein
VVCWQLDHLFWVDEYVPRQIVRGLDVGLCHVRRGYKGTEYRDEGQDHSCFLCLGDGTVMHEMRLSNIVEPTGDVSSLEDLLVCSQIFDCLYESPLQEVCICRYL